MIVNKLIGPLYEDKTKRQSYNKLINWYVTENKPGSEYPFSWIHTPGTQVWNTYGTGPIRGAVVQDNIAYVVSGQQVFKILEDGSSTLLGTVSKGQTPVQIEAFSDEIVFNDKERLFSYQITNNDFSEIVDAVVPSKIQSITQQDSYLIFVIPETSRFQISASQDSRTYDALDTATKNGKGDGLVAAKSFNKYLFLFGNSTTEPWINSGDADFTFTTQPGVLIEYGCVAADSPIIAANTLYWLGRNSGGAPLVIRLEGLQPRIISTRPINAILHSLQFPETCYTWSYTEKGHEFILFSFPKDKRTLVFDASTELWHERNYYNGYSFSHHIGTCHIYFAGKHLIGSKDNGSLLEFSSEIYTDCGDTIYRTGISDHIESDGRYLSMYNMQIMVNTGQALSTGQGSDPQLMMRLSRDYGNNWGIVNFLPVGGIGDYNKMCLYTRAGASRQFTIELTATDPIPWDIVGMRAEIETGQSSKPGATA